MIPGGRAAKAAGPPPPFPAQVPLPANPAPTPQAATYSRLDEAAHPIRGESQRSHPHQAGMARP